LFGDFLYYRVTAASEIYLAPFTKVVLSREERWIPNKETQGASPSWWHE
jgi:hypothetical protein